MKTGLSPLYDIEMLIKFCVFLEFCVFLVSFFMYRSYLAYFKDFGKIPDAKQLLFVILKINFLSAPRHTFKN